MTANRMIIIDKGRKITEGNVAELFDPSKMLIRVTINNIDVIAPQLEQSVWQDLIKEQEENEILFQMEQQNVPALTAALVNMGAAISAVQPQHSLEAYFLALTTDNRHVDTLAN
jgi:ABC-2 type transport system ATP-binding protein